MLYRILREPPFRLFVKSVLKYLPIPCSARTRDLWEISARPQYFLGVRTAAKMAINQGVQRICVIEFGCAGGNGLLALEAAADAIEREMDLQISVFGFDAGTQGLPPLIGDFRDHPDFWQAGDFQMNVDALRERLSRRTELVLGDVATTVPEFVSKTQNAPIGFASFDLDLYSSTSNALKVFSHPEKSMLRQVPLYFDDIEFIVNHRWAGEFLAINEFNERNKDVKIDKWYGVRNGRPFHDRSYLDRMFVAHDLKAITKTALNRSKVTLPLR